MRAGAGGFSEYVFTNEGVLKIRIVNPLTLPSSVIGLLLLFQILAQFGKIPGYDTLAVSYLTIALLSSFLIVQLIAWVERKRLGRMTISQLKSSHKGKLIPWGMVKSVEAKSLRRLAVQTPSEIYYMGAWSKKTRNDIVQFASSRVVIE